MSSQQEIVHTIALTKLKGLTLLNARKLLDTLGSASEVFAHRADILSVVPEGNERLAQAFAQADEAVREAEAELEFVENKRLRVYTLADEAYPRRLRECDDAPLALFYYGTANLDAPHVVSIVGTRRCTDYGREMCDWLVADLKRLCPDTLIVSGLAYGIDICAHRAALEQGLPTVGVLAHGLDKIYPSMHRKTAADMARQGGGLLTEYPSGTRPEKMNFVQRNRIVAGLCDACVVVESSQKGGSLITADLALNYNREVFAFPGRASDDDSRGCNNLIRSHQATLITCAADLAEAMGWAAPQPKQTGRAQAVQQELFPDFTDEEKTILAALRGADDLHINQIVIKANIPYARASALLFELELKGVVRPLGGARYKLRSVL